MTSAATSPRWRLGLFLGVLAWLFCACDPARATTQCDNLLARKKITLVVAFKPGGGYDAYARMFAPVLQEHTGARVVVSNVVGANGNLGVKAVGTAAPDSLTLGLFDLRDLLTARLEDATLPAAGDFVALGSFGTTIGVWGARQGAGQLLEGNQPLTFATSTGMLPRVLLPVMLMGREVRLVRGYGGLAERWLALLRGDVDITDGSDDTIGRFISTSPGTMPLLVLASAPLPQFPGTPHLAGPGGLVDLRTRQLDAATRRNRMDLATLATELSASSRTLVIARTAHARVQDCLEAAVERSLFSSAMRETAERHKLHIEPLRSRNVREQVARIEASISRNQALLKHLASTGNTRQ